MPKTPQTRADLEQHLNEQLGFLRRSAEAYDDGYTDEAKRLATTIRVLVHDTKNSTSLLTHLNEKQRQFWDSSVPDVEGNMMPHGGLVHVAAGLHDATCMPYLDMPLPRGVQPRLVDFEAWWTTPIIRTTDGDTFARRDLILAVADQDGGAHVDAKLDEAYAKLSREVGMGWTYTGSKGTHVIRPADRAAVRQIAHEVLKTFDSSYTKQPKQPQGTILNIGPSVLVVSGAEERAIPVEIVVKQEVPAANRTLSRRSAPLKRELPKVGRNDPCPCGSGRKWKKCHGR